MAAYILSDVTVRDADAFANYRSAAAVSIARHGGRYLVRGGEIQVLEGTWTPRVLIVVEFPDIDAARAWYRSPDYAEALVFRDQASSRNLLLIEGVPTPL